jgi:hypothetical protein
MDNTNAAKGEEAISVRNVSLGKCYSNLLVLDVKPTRGLASSLVVIVDSSPSMNGRKMHVAKVLGESLIRLAGLLGISKVDVYSFCRELQELGSGTPQEALDAIKTIKLCVGTNLFEALSKAYSENENTGVVIITDGRPSVGPKRPEKILNSLLKLVSRRDLLNRKIVIALVGEDADKEIAEKIVNALGGFVYKARKLESRDVALIALYAGLADVIPAKIAVGLPAWATIEAYNITYKKLNNGWLEFNVLEHALTGRTIVMNIKSNLDECGEDLMIPMLGISLKLVEHEVVESETIRKFVKLRFRPINMKYKRID